MFDLINVCTLWFFFKGTGGRSGGSGGSGISKSKNRIREFNKKSMCIINDKCLFRDLQNKYRR